MAARPGDDELRGECMATRIVVLNDLDQHELRRAIADELIEIGERVGRTKLSLAGLVSRIDAGLIVGDLDGAAADVERVEAALAREPDPPRADAARLLPPVAASSSRAGSTRPRRPTSALTSCAGRVAVVGRRGEHVLGAVRHPTRAGPARRDAAVVRHGDRRRPGADPQHPRRCWWRSAGTTRARAVLGPAGIRRPIEDWYWIAEAVTAAELACELGDLELAAELQDQLRPFSGLLSCNGSITTGPPVDLHLGRLDRLLGDGAAAHDHLRGGARPGRADRRRPSRPNAPSASDCSSARTATPRPTSTSRTAELAAAHDLRAPSGLLPHLIEMGALGLAMAAARRANFELFRCPSGARRSWSRRR